MKNLRVLQLMLSISFFFSVAHAQMVKLTVQTCEGNTPHCLTSRAARQLDGSAADVGTYTARAYFDVLNGDLKAGLANYAGAIRLAPADATLVVYHTSVLTYVAPDGERHEYARVAQDLPKAPLEIKPHPHGVELGMLLRMLHDSPGKTVKQVLMDDFSRISAAHSNALCRPPTISTRLSRKNSKSTISHVCVYDPDGSFSTSSDGYCLNHAKPRPSST